MNKTQLYFNWSTGKDSALALYKLLKSDTYQIKKLVTTVNTHYDRVTMHGLRREMMLRQVESIGIPHKTIELSETATMEEYEDQMNKVIIELKSEGVYIAGFGDIYLEDLKKYREDNLKVVGVDCVFPLWKKDTKELLTEFLELGFKAITVCVDGHKLGKEFVGRVIDEEFINQLPSNVDPCGENGEFHTFCFDGPIFKQKVRFKKGEVITRFYDDALNPGQKKPFYFCDILSD